MRHSRREAVRSRFHRFLLVKQCGMDKCTLPYKLLIQGIDEKAEIVLVKLRTLACDGNTGKWILVKENGSELKQEDFEAMAPIGPYSTSCWRNS
ncbi:hypothetical protein PMAYCL1PPCAC_04159 [Pristionchus mayeri]|uniref:Uncharacterized protein n=1 Tax=Pristionchus mayeri TaxID=1317129 RepID=A0AAN5C9L6_9BILA|nr:hypothetical protein PMAYCL1PPCAC_04159 [Pristionchus mayeri]